MFKSSAVSMCDPIKNSRLQFFEHVKQWVGILVMCRWSEGGAKVSELQWRVRSLVSRNMDPRKSALATLNRRSG